MNKKIYLFLFLIIFIVFIYLVWFYFFSEEAKLKRDFDKQYKQYLTVQENYKKAMQEDVYGGKTPEETLKLFIEALKKEDIELASKYFMLETNTQSPDYLTRNKWIRILNELKEKNSLNILLINLNRAKPVNSIMENYFIFEVKNEKNELIGDIILKFNQYSNVWKIESL